MRLERSSAIRIFREIGPVGEPFLEEDVHRGAGERAVGAGARHQVDVGHFGRGRAIGIDHDEGRLPLLPGAGDPAHQIDLRRDRIAAPHDDEVGLRDLARVSAALHAGAGTPAGIGERVAIGRMLARIAHRVAQTLDPVALHEPHGAGIEERPHRLGAEARCGAGESFGHFVERVVPRDRLKAPLALGADAPQRRCQPIGMVLALGIARDLGAHDAGGVAVLGAADAADRAPVEPLDLERADARAIVRTDGRHNVARHGGNIAANTHSGKAKAWPNRGVGNRRFGSARETIFRARTPKSPMRLRQNLGSVSWLQTMSRRR